MRSMCVCMHLHTWLPCMDTVATYISLIDQHGVNSHQPLGSCDLSSLMVCLSGGMHGNLTACVDHSLPLKLTHGSIFSIGKTPIIIKHSSTLKILNQTTTNVFSQQFCPHVKTTMQEPKHTSETSLCLLTLWGTGEGKLQSCVEKHRMVKADHWFSFLLLSLSFALTLWAAALRLITFSPCDHFCSLADPKAMGGSLYSWPPQAKLASDFTFPCSWILCSCGKCDKER